MHEGESPGVQKHPFQSLPRKHPIPCEVTILVVAGKRKPKVRQMNTNLMRAPGLEFRFEQCEWRIVARPQAHSKEGCRRLAALVIDANTSVAVGRCELVQRKSHQA